MAKGRPLAHVFGAGVTGLTAAHELAERGFAVIVYESEGDVDDPGRPAVGGMARTQWSELNQTFFDQLSTDYFVPTKAVLRTPWSLVFDRGETEVRPEHWIVIRDVANWLARNGEVETLFIEGFAFDEDDMSRVAEKRAQNVLVELLAAGAEDGRLEVVGFGDVLPQDRFSPEAERRCVRFRIRRARFPGEHGYRFFPSFYHHLFDTMKRTPILTPVRRLDVDVARLLASGADTLTEEMDGTEYVETGRTAFDQLRPLPAHAIAGADGKRPAKLTRQRIESYEGFRNLINTCLEDLHFRASDIAIFNARLFKFVTSCDERRAKEFTSISWLKFIDSPHYSDEFRQAMDKWPYSLVALKASQCDAYTHGVTTIQLFLDQVRKDFTDGTLIGPTSSAWLEPWKLYLRTRHRVRFRRWRLCCFHWENGLRAIVKKYEKGKWSEPDLQNLGGYLVLALPVEKVASVFPPTVLQKIAEEAEHAGIYETARNDVQLAVDLSLAIGGKAWAPDQMDCPEGGTPGAWNVPRARGALRHFSGVQFYFDEDVDWVDGHTYYTDSEWGLSSVTQSIHWATKFSRLDLFRAIVSVDIGIFDAPGGNGKTAWQCSREELAREVWRQVQAGAEADDLKVPQPSYYHVDENLVFEPNDGPIRENKSPFFVPLAGQWEKRPGEPRDYRVYLGKLVLAGTYMKTFTRLTTMEAANESARHAVNAILHDRYRRGKGASMLPCDTRSMEEREPEDMAFLKEVDRELFKRGRGHFMDLYQWETWPMIGVGTLLRMLRRLIKG